MIYKIKKNLSSSQEDYAIVSSLGELLCKVAVMTNGYYLYNKNGLQLAQIKIEDGKAYLSIARERPAFPGTIVLQGGQDKFDISYLEPTEADKAVIETLCKAEAAAYTVWGMPSQNNYDLYLGSKKCANIVPCATNPEIYNINILDAGNALNIIMLAIAMDTFNK